MRYRLVAVYLKSFALFAGLSALCLTAGCKGSGGGSSFFLIPTRTPRPTSTPKPTPTTPRQTPTPTHTVSITPTPAPFVNYGVAVVGDDVNGFTHGLQVIRVEDGSGKPLPTPLETFAPLNANDIDGISITPDGRHGAVVDGGNHVFFFSSDFSTGTITILPATVDVTSFGGDGDAIASLSGGDSVVVSAGGIATANLALISGILSGHPVIADSIPTSRRGVEYDGLVSSADGLVMLSRAAVGRLLDVYSIMAVTPHPGPLGGTVAFEFTLTNTETVPPVASLDGREGMAISPTDSRRAIVVGGDGTVDLLTDLPANVTFKDSLRLASAATAVTISNDGKFAIVATTSGLVVLSGVDTDKLVQVGSVYSPVFSTPSGNCRLDDPHTVGMMADGKFIVTIQDCNLPKSGTHIGSGVMLTIPFSAGTLGAAVGQLNFAVTPDDDQIVTH